MSLEPGGRSDKYGNEYENRYLAHLLIRLVNEKLKSVTVEPLGENSDSAEYIAETQAGIIEYYQCKASNGTCQSWTVASLKTHNVFERIKRIVECDPNAQYHFISTLPFHELDELCKRTRTSSSVDEMVNYSLTNKDIKKAYTACITAFGFDKNNREELEKLYHILGVSFFEQEPNTETEIKKLEELISLTFTGDPASARSLLENYANTNGKYGIKISGKDIVDYLAAGGHYLRANIQGDRTLLRINSLNHDYWDRCPGINGRMLHRTATDQVVAAIQNGFSVVLHGRAGTGKSGCLQEVIDHLEQNGILYLSVKMDKYVPKGSADQYGKDLGLPQTPVYSLTNLAAGNTCVLILDQLDALRWTGHHSSTALGVCKEMISQANAVNSYLDGRISIVFASRTFDLENDSGLQRLFMSEEQQLFAWDKINVDPLSENEVIDLIGPSFKAFSRRLKKVLCIPSALYVWTKILPQKRVSSIASTNELISQWWNQILDTCEENCIARSDAIRCRDKLITYMESTSTFVLSRRLLADYDSVVSLFISEGMLRCDSDNLAFTHQSFLDFFISRSILEGVYSGAEITTLIPAYEEQIPSLRYCLLVVLRDLLDSNQRLFAEQSRIILDSDAVRYYYKCCVFEIVGQSENPDDFVLSLIDDYLVFLEWRDFIVQSVLTRHPVFVKHYAQSVNNWLDDQNLSLLKSISDIDPVFVMSVLKSYSCKSIEYDRKIHWVLPFDIANEPEEVFCFRLQLLDRHPELLNDYYLIHDLIAKNSPRAVDLLAVILRNYSSQSYRQFYLDSDSGIKRYARKNYNQITRILLPLITEQTKDFLPSWPFHYYQSEYKEWTEHSYGENFIRKIVTITGYALSETARTSGDSFCSYVKCLKYPISGVVHELVMCAMRELSIEYSDFCISWLLSDFRTKVFVFSGEQSDYLAYTKAIISKFSSFCSPALFKTLEQVICCWKDDKERILNTLRARNDAMKQNGVIPSYYSYWGHFQKMLLPFMDNNRLSYYARDLIRVLNRNEWIQVPHYYSGFSGGMARTVISPVDSHTECLSNRNWLQIISTPVEKMQGRFYGDDSGQFYIEANHEMFSSSLGKQAKLEPARFAKLSLSFPENCYPGYISRVLDSLGEVSNADSPVPVELLSQVIRRYKHLDSVSVAISITRVVERHAEQEWPDDILAIIADLATSHPNPAANEYAVTSSEDPDHISSSSLLNNAINCVRGCAVRSIGEILWHHSDLAERFKETIVAASNDPNDAVRFSVMFCILPLFNVDALLSEQLFKKLVSQDLRVLKAPDSWEILARTYDMNRKWYRKKLDEALESGIEDLSEYVAQLYCAIAVFQDDQFILNALMERSFTNKLQNEICKQAISSFSDVSFHERSEQIIRHFVEIASDELPSLAQLFYNDHVDIKRDGAFLRFLMQSNQGPRLLHSFMYHLKEADCDICEYAEIIYTIGNAMEARSNCWKDAFSIDDFVGCVMRLFDQGKDKPDVQAICLDVWDKLYASNIHGMKSFSDMIESDS